MSFKVFIADSENDRILTKLALRSCSSFELVGEAGRGDEVFNYLLGNGEYADRARYPLPDLLLIGGSLPIANAAEVLAWLKQHAIKLVVIVFTGTLRPQDCEQFLQMGANACYEKQPDLTHLQNSLLEVERHMADGSYQR